MSEDYEPTPQPPDESIDDFSAPDPPEVPDVDPQIDDEQGGPDFGDMPELPTQTDNGTSINYDQSAQNNAEIRALADQIKQAANQFGIEPVKHEDPPSVEELIRKVADLERQIQEIQPQQFEREGNQVDPFVACFRGTNTAATELMPLSGALVTFSGRILDSTYKALDMTSSDFAAIQFFNPASGITEYIKIGGNTGSTSAPKTIGSAAEGSEAAETTTWSIASDAKALDIWIQSRTAYYDAGDQVLYGYMRKFQFDSLGNLYAVSGETRFTVDAPTACGGSNGGSA